MVETDDAPAVPASSKARWGRGRRGGGRTGRGRGDVGLAKVWGMASNAGSSPPLLDWAVCHGLLKPAPAK